MKKMRLAKISSAKVCKTWKVMQILFPVDKIKGHHAFGTKKTKQNEFCTKGNEQWVVQTHNKGDKLQKPNIII